MIDRVGKVRRFLHIILKVAAHAVLRAEHCGDVDPRRDQRIQAMRQIRCNRSRVGQQRHALALQRFAQRRVCEQAVNAKKRGHAASGAGNEKAKQ
jgi:hypothetical protein